MRFGLCAVLLCLCRNSWATIAFITPSGVALVDDDGSNYRLLGAGFASPQLDSCGIAVDAARNVVLWMENVDENKSTFGKVWRLPLDAPDTATPTLVTETTSGMRLFGLALDTASDTAYLTWEVSGRGYRILKVDSYSTASGLSTSKSDEFASVQGKNEGGGLTILGGKLYLLAASDDDKLLFEWTPGDSSSQRKISDLKDLGIPENFFLGSISASEADGTLLITAGDKTTWPASCFVYSPSAGNLTVTEGVIPPFVLSRSREEGIPHPGVAGIGNATGKAIVGSSTSIGVVTLGSAAVDTIYANDFGEPGMGPFYWYAQPPSATDAPVPTNTTAPATLAPASSAPADGSAAPANRSEAPGTGAPQTGAPQTGAPAVPTEGPVDAVPGPTNAAADEEEGSGGGGGNDTVWIVVVVCLVLVIMCLVVLYCRAQRQRAESDQAAADRKLDSFHSAMSEHRTVELQHVPQSPPYGPCPPPPQPPPPLPPLPPGSPAARRVSYDRLDSSLRSDADYPLLFWPGFGRDSPSSPHRAPPSADASVRGFRAAGREPKTAAAYDRIAAMYAKYNPEQAHTIDALIDKYGDEALLKTLVDKYGPEPESPAVLAASVNSTVLSQPGHRGSLIPYSGSPLFPQANVSMHSLQSHFPPSSPATHSRRRATLNAALVS